MTINHLVVVRRFIPITPIPKIAAVLCLLQVVFLTASGQRYLSDFDSTMFIRDSVRPLVKRFENLHLSGYIQPQFQKASEEGIDSYNGGDFSRFSDKRFMLRRARVKIDYLLPAENKPLPAALFSFQIDATERGVNVRDMFLKLFDPWQGHFSITAGLFARPFGFEVNLSSSYRETPERGRASQILMPSERDLGAMLTYESQKKTRKNPLFKFDVGLFNGQGLSGPRDFDSYKDLISRITLKPAALSPLFEISGGLSLLNGGWRQATRTRYEMADNGVPLFVVDSSISNIGKKAPRQYYGADMQLVYRHGWGKTELRGEYWKGKQPGSFNETSNPGELPEEDTYIRPFDAAFLLFLQNIGSSRWEIMAKLDWYDPNTKVKGADIGVSGSNLSTADIKYTTLGTGITWYMNDQMKLLAYYDLVRNESTKAANYLTDRKDDIFTLRMQLRF